MSNYQVNLQFTADTNQAKTQLQSLQQQLSAIVNTPIGIGEKLTPSIQQASNAAAELKVHLQNATNVNTGTLDFGKFNNSIKQSGMSLSEYGAKLQSLGPKGQQAFMTLANSVAAAEVPLRRSSSALTGMMTTLKNTAKWQLSSSLLHGFISSVQSAYGYAQDLNESLNNIRIVTGQNIDQMAKFAVEANRAARALSTTTTEYTNASLIYYQQGLNDAQVRERTDVTIKMANASRQSAEIVSDQLTAIWNNFDNGTKTLEYYADVVTALGAATASSSEEIATGLEKFASVAETVGLSYEYATAALATVTATTRQSADVVGTAFKTLFARLQDLKLGETLDDGTTLGTYSENLRKVGVEIKDSSGQLKDMDIILDEVAEKWRTLDRDQQVALAKGVAGIRQYNTFMSLMSNWDFMEENLKTVEASGGTLQKQADTYAESWDAAQKRVKASAEKLYSALFDDKFFIDLTNGFGGLIDKVGDFIQSIGGLQGVLSSLGLVVTKVFAQQMAQGFRNLVYNIKMSTEAGRFAVQEAKKLEMEKLAGMMAKSSASTATEIQTKNVYSQELQLQTELIANSERMTAEEQKKYQILLEQHRTIGQQSIELQKQVELLREQNASTSLEIMGEGMLNNSGMTRKDSFAMMNAEMEKMRTGAKGLGEVTMALDAISTKSEASETDITRLKVALEQAGMSQDDIEGLSHCFDDLQTHGKTATGAMEEIKATLNTINSEKIRQVLNAAGIEEGTAQYNRLTQALKQYIATGSEAHIKEVQLSTTNENLKLSFESLQASIKRAGVNMQDWATHLTGAVSGLMSAGMLISSFNGLMNTINDPDASGWEKFGSVLTSVAMIVMSFTGVIKGLTSVYKFATEALNKETLAKVANALASHIQAKEAAKVAASQDIEEKETRETTNEINKQTAAKVANKTADEMQFKGKNGRVRTYAGAKNKKGQLLDTNGNIISDKYVQKYNLNNFGKTTPTKKPPTTSGSKSLLNPGTLKTLGSALGKIAGVAAGIAIVATVITSAIAQYNKFEKAAQDAATAAEMVSKRYQEAKSAYEELSSTSSDYQESLKAMDELTKGTIEYKEALLKANEQAISLINNYKDLAGHYTIKDGLILIDEDALARVQQKELEKLGKIQASSILADSYSREKQSEAEKIKFNRDMNSRSDNIHTVQNTVVTTLGGMAAGALIGSSVPVIGTIIGGIVGLLGGIIATEVAGAQSRAEQEATNKVIMYVQEHGNDIFGAKNAKDFGDMLAKEGLKIDDDKLVQSLYDNRKALQELTKAEVARLAQDKADWSAAYAAYNQGNENYMNAENQTYLNNAGYQSAEGLDSGLVKEVTDQVRMLWNGSNDDFWAAYLREVMHDKNVDEGTTTGESYRVTDLGGDYVTLQKKNESGTWENVGEKDSLSESAAEAALIDARAMSRASEEIPDLLEEYSKLSAELISAGLEENSDALQHILNARAGKEKIDLSAFGYEVMAGIDTSKILDDDLRESVEVAIQDFKNALPEAMKTDAFKEYYDQLSDMDKELLWTIDIDKNYTLDQIRDVLEQAKILAAGEKLQLKIESTTDILELYKDPEKVKESKDVIKKYFESLETGMDFDDFWAQSFASQEAFFKAILSDNEEDLDNWIDDVNSRNYDEYKKEHQGEYNADVEARKTEAENVKKQINTINTAKKFSDYEKDATEGGVSTYLLNSIATGAKLVGDETSREGASKFFRDIAEEYDVWKMAYKSTHGYDYSGTVDEMWNDAVWQKMLEDEGLTIDDMKKQSWYSSYVNNSLPKVMALDTTELQTQHNELTADLSYDEWYEQQEDKAKELSVSARKSRQLNVQERLGIDNDEFATYTEQIKTANQYLKDHHDVAEDVAMANLKMNKGIENLNSHLNDYGDILKDSTKKYTPQYSAALKDIRQDMADILDLNLSTLSDDFLTNEHNLELMKKAAEGDAQAIEELRIKAAQEIVLGVRFDEDGFSESETAVLAAINALTAEDLTIGCSLNNTQFGQSLYDAAVAAGSTVGDIREMFEALGWEPKIELKRVSVAEAQTMAGESTVDVIDPITGEVTPVKGDMIANFATNGFVTIPSINGDATIYKGGASETVTPKEPTGGGGNKPQKTSKTHQTKVVDRYKEINDAIEESKKVMDDASRAADGLWGKARLKEMEKVRNEMGKQLQLLRQRKAAAMTDLTEDQNWLNNTIAQEYGITFTFDKNGLISNYYEVMDQLHQELRDAEIRAGETLDKDSEKEEIDAINEKISALEEAIDIYEATRKEVNDTDTAIKEMIRSIQEANLEELDLKLEFELMIDDSQLEMLEYYLGKVKDDIWGMTEALAIMPDQAKIWAGRLGQMNEQNEFEEGNLGVYRQRYEDLLYSYTHIDPKTGETFINQEQFVKKLQELQSDIYDNLNNIHEMDKTMIAYYGDTLAAAGEELSKFTNLMEHHVDVLDHYSSLLEIMGKSKDWAKMKTILQTQVEVAENSAEVSKANYKMLETEAAEKKRAWEALGKGLGDELTYEESVIKQQWLDAQAAADEAQTKMLEDAEAWAEALKNLLETELEELGENLEKALAGDFGSLDYMMTSMERANSLQEEYLTTTNKVYETNKLMRTAQQEIDKTSNTVAKRRMAQFIEETQQMQNQNKLSQYELEIQQAKYDLLLAEIALEEAQSAKSTVRLQRDSEGNFGYVYTADQNEVANAQQQLEDAQNALYNIGLEGANKYAEQYAQTIQEMNDAVRELTEQWQNGEIASKEEYQAKMLELEEYYGEKLKQFSHLHSIAVQTDSRVANDAWTRDFAHMTTQTGTWMSAVTGYASQVGVAFNNYQKGIAEVEQYAGADLDSLKLKTENIKTENEKLVTSITDPDKGLLNAMQQEIDKVGEIVLQYAEWRDTIQAVIDKQEELAKKVSSDIEKETDDDTTNDYQPITETTPPEGESNGNPGDDGTPSYKKGVLSWTGNGSARIWADSAGKTYSATSAEGRAIQTAFNKAYGANGGYKGDYFLGWNKLNADVLHEKYGLSTGGYTGDWSGSFGKLAFLHQKELVLNKQDTENLLAAMEFLNRITSAIDLQAMNNSLGGLLSSPSLGHVGDESGILEQQVHIEASFPGVSDRNELEEAFNNLINQAAQYANRK